MPDGRLAFVPHPEIYYVDTLSDLCPHRIRHPVLSSSLRTTKSLGKLLETSLLSSSVMSDNQEKMLLDTLLVELRSIIWQHLLPNLHSPFELDLSLYAPIPNHPPILPYDERVLRDECETARDLMMTCSTFRDKLAPIVCGHLLPKFSRSIHVPTWCTKLTPPTKAMIHSLRTGLPGYSLRTGQRHEIHDVLTELTGLRSPFLRCGTVWHSQRENSTKWFGDHLEIIQELKTIFPKFVGCYYKFRHISWLSHWSSSPADATVRLTIDTAPTANEYIFGVAGELKKWNAAQILRLADAN